jgi:hypothetical protein
MNHELSATLRAHANGLYSLETATELIISHHTFPHHGDSTSVIMTSPTIINQTEITSID